MPDPSLDTFFFWNSGAEAMEGAVKVARSATGRQNIIAMQGGYHGRTFGAMALTRSKVIYSEGVAPLMVRLAVSYVILDNNLLVYSPVFLLFRFRIGINSLCHPKRRKRR